MLRQTRKIAFAFVLTAAALLLSGSIASDRDADGGAYQTAARTIVDPAGVT